MNAYTLRKSLPLIGLFCVIFPCAAQGQAPAAAAPAAAPPAPAAASATDKNICPPRASELCLDQPVQGQTGVSGKAPKGKVEITVGASKHRKTVKVKKGKFKWDGLTPLVAGDEISVSSSDGKAQGAVRPGLCAKQQPLPPCLDQPVANAASVTGQAAVGSVTVTVIGKALPESPITASPDAKGNFIAKLPQPLGIYDQVGIGDAKGNIIAGPVSVVTSSNGADGSSGASSCTAQSAPCIDTPTPSATSTQITGYVTPGATPVELSLNNVPVPIKPSPDGSFKVGVAALVANESIALTQTASGNTTTITAPVTAPPSTPGTSSSLYTLGLTGVDVTSTSVSGPQMQYFASFDVMAPVPFLGHGLCPRGEEDHPLAQKCWLWFSPRISSAPTAASSALSSFSTPTSLASGIGGQTVGQITQTFDFQTGFEWDAFNQPWRGRQFGWGTTWARSTISLILGGGATTPLSSTANAQEYALNDNLGAQFTAYPKYATTYSQLAQALCGFGFTATVSCTSPAAATTAAAGCTPTGASTSSSPCYVAFVLQNRSRFEREYFGGFRLRTYYFTGACKDAIEQGLGETASNSCKVENTYPGTFDVRFGEDETVTAGHLRGVVMTLAGSYPLPGTSGTVRIFGAEYLRLHKNSPSEPLALLAASPAVPITDDSVVIQEIAPTDQDYYRLGIGVDLIALISKWFTNSKATSSGTSQ